MNHEQILHRRIRWLTGLFIVGLLLSGITAIPLRTELDWLTHVGGFDLSAGEKEMTAVGFWLLNVRHALDVTSEQFPFLFYGTDWLAFGHFVIAVAFIGALRDPVRNRWLYDFGLIACALVIPFALVMGGVRGISFWWRLVDCSFGIFGAMPLWFCRTWAIELDRQK
jgi:hypothetical protein